MNAMKKILFILLVLFAAKADGQVFQKPVGYGFEYRRLITDTLFAFPNDTFTVITNLKAYKWAARKGDSIYVWSQQQDMWVLAGGAGGGGGGSGTVIGVTGTANRITITGTPTVSPIVDIAATYVGQTSITTLGTITTGVWNGTAIANANLANSTISGISLGSNLNSLTSGFGVLYSSGTTYNGSAAITARVDTSSGGVKSWVGVQKIIDSLVNIGGIYRYVDGNYNVSGGYRNYGGGPGSDNILLGHDLGNSMGGSRNILIGRLQAPRLIGSDIISIGYNNFPNLSSTGGNSAPAIAIGANNGGYGTYKNFSIGIYNNGYNVDSVPAVNAQSADNFAIGVENLFNHRVGVDNMVFSWDGFQNLDSGSYNNGMGQYVFESLADGHHNNAYGFKAGRRINHGDFNTFIGDSAGHGSTTITSTGATFIGARTFRTIPTSMTNVTVIGYQASAGQDNFMALGKAGTRVGIGRATASESIHSDSAIIIGPAANTVDGTIRYAAGIFEFRQSGAWVALGGSSGLTVGTTTITSGTNTNILYNNAGTLGEYTVTGTGTTAVLSTSPTFTTDITTPLVIGGTGTTTLLTLKSTTGVGTTNSGISLLVGNNGAVQSGFFDHLGNLGIGTTTPSTYLPGGSGITINGSSGNVGLSIRNGSNYFLQYNTGTILHFFASASSSNIFSITSSSVSVGGVVATARLHLPGGSATANTAPLKINSGTVMATTEAGAIENSGSHLYVTFANSGTRYQLDQQWGVQGADVASVAGAIALGADGNAFEITGTNAITLISNTIWQNGSVITLAFTSTATLTDGTANSGTDIGMELAGNTNFVASAGATVTLRLMEIGGTQRWREISRSVN